MGKWIVYENGLAHSEFTNLKKAWDFARTLADEYLNENFDFVEHKDYKIVLERGSIEVTIEVRRRVKGRT